MISLVLTSIILMATITIYHFKNENQRYHTNRLERKEKKILTHIDLILEENKEISTKDEAIQFIEHKLKELKIVHNLRIELYDINGVFLSSSELDSEIDRHPLDSDILDKLSQKHFFIEEVEGKSLWRQINLRSFSYIQFNNENIGILYLPYIQENTIFRTELEYLLWSYAKMYVFILLGAILFAFMVSSYITSSLKKIGIKINKTKLDSNEPLRWNSDDEIGKLVIAYNSMVQKLEESTRESLKSERENAWREMAKQVAHEIKNPLTPMRLQVQLLERNAHKMSNEDESNKILDFTKGMLLQIDTLTRIATEFSSFAKMPKQQLKEVDFGDFADRFSKLHSHSKIDFTISKEQMLVSIDEKQFSRVLNNILKNAEQSIPLGREAEIKMSVEKDNDYIKISISDNGIGIKEMEESIIFEPKFTTKSGGMGLGLGISKNIIESLGGRITFKSEQNIGTNFYIFIPLINKKN